MSTLEKKEKEDEESTKIDLAKLKEEKEISEEKLKLIEASIKGLEITAEDPNKVIISYPGSLEDTLQPKEDIGNKVVNVRGFTDYSVTKYWIKVKLVNKADGKVLDEKIQWLTVKK